MNHNEGMRIWAVVLLVFGAAIDSAPTLAQGVREKANEQVVLGYMEAMDRAAAAGTLSESIPQIARQFWTRDCIQHKVGVESGRAGLIAAIRSMAKDPHFSTTPRAANHPENLAIMAAGDRVILVRRRLEADPKDPSKSQERIIFNMYRLKNGQIAEHWDGSS